MSAYREFSGKTVEEALREAREAFGVGLDGLDFEILTPGTRGVLGMGAEPARIVAAPRAALGGAAPKREAAESLPLPAAPAHDRDRDRGPRRDDRGPRRDDRGDRGRGFGGGREGGRAEGARPERHEAAPEVAPRGEERPVERTERADRPERAERPGRADRGERGERPDRGPRRDDRGPRREAPRRAPELTPTEVAELAAARGSVASERAELEAAEASPEALAAAKEILEELMEHLGFEVRVDIETGETSRLNVTGEGDEKEALGALIGRKGERLSALQHLVNLMLSKRLGGWTRVLVDVEDYRGRRERQLREIAQRAAARVVETGSILQLEPMPALERRWVHIALRDHPDVMTQSVGEEPNRRIVILPRPA